MIRVRHIVLFFSEGNSDKVYEIDLCETGADQFVVNFRYGRRGSSLKEGTKTIFPVNRQEADKVFDALEAEKRKKGYKASGESAEPLLNVLKSSTKKELKEGNQLIKALKAELNEAGSSNWKLSRIIWRIGELKTKEALPLIQHYITKAASQKEGSFELYSCIWAFGRCADAAFYADVKKLAGSDLPLHFKQFALAASVLMVPEQEKTKLKEDILLSMPGSLKESIDKNDSEELSKRVHELLYVTKASNQDFVLSLYLLSLLRASLRKCILDVIKKLPVKAGYFRSMRRIYKWAEMAEDHESLGLLYKKIQDAEIGYGSYVYIDSKWINVHEEKKKADSRIAFSKATKTYFIGRVLRTLKRRGEAASADYTRMATEILLQFNDDKDKQHVRSDSKTTYHYNQQTRSYSSETKTTWFDTHSSYLALYYILHANSPRYVFKRGNLAYKCKSGWKPGDAVMRVREDAFPLLWNKDAQNVLRLMKMSNCKRVVDFAVDVFKGNPEFEQQVNNRDIIDLLYSPFQEVNEIAFNLARARFSTGAADKELIAALFTCKSDEANRLAMQWIEAKPEEFCNDVPFILSILYSKNSVTHAWLAKFLSKFNPADAVVQEVMTSVNRALLTDVYSEGDETYLYSLATVLEEGIAPRLKQLNEDTLELLINHTFRALHAVAASLLSGFSHTEKIPERFMMQLLMSEDEFARRKTMALIARFPAAYIASKKNLILSLALSPLPDMRLSSHALIEKLIAYDANAGTEVAELFIPVLTVKEKYEGLHADIVKLLTEKLGDCLAHVSAKRVLQLCFAKSVSTQSFGNFLLKRNVKLSSLTMDDLVRLGNTSIEDTRQLIFAFFKSDIARIKNEKKEAIRLADSLWPDARIFAFSFFKEHFDEGDWEPSMFITLCDSVKEDVQAFGREMISRWFKAEDGFSYLMQLSQHPDQRMQLFASTFFEQYLKNNPEAIEKLSFFFTTLLSQINKGRAAKQRAIQVLRTEAMQNEQTAALVSIILNRVSATVAIEEKALYILAMRDIAKKFPAADVLLKLNETTLKKKTAITENAV